MIASGGRETPPGVETRDERNHGRGAAVDAAEPSRAAPRESDEAPEEGLSPLERRVLEFESMHPRPSSAKTETIRRTLGLTESQYYHALGALMRSSAAIAEYPGVIGRLRRSSEGVRDDRARKRRLRLEREQDAAARLARIREIAEHGRAPGSDPDQPTTSSKGAVSTS